LIPGGTWLIAADYATGNILPLSPFAFSLGLSAIAQNTPNVIALTGDGDGTVFMISQTGATPFAYSVDYPAAPKSTRSTNEIPFCPNGIAFDQGIIFGLLTTGVIQPFDLNFNPLNWTVPQPPAGAQLVGLAVDARRGMLYVVSPLPEPLIYYCDLAHPTSWTSVDPNADLDPYQKPLSPGDFIGKWISLIAPAAAKLGPATQPVEEYAERLALASIVQGLANLRTFPSIALLEKRGILTLHGAYFGILDGKLLALDESSGRFQPVSQEAHAATLAEPRF
jgi:hypothetical protein